MSGDTLENIQLERANAEKRMRERRQFGRRTTLWHAWIQTSNRQRLACCIRNVSESGALLELDVPLWLPNVFELWVEERDIRLRCELRHRGQHGVGVQFDDFTAARNLLALCRAARELEAAAQKIEIGKPSGASDDARLTRPKLTPEMIRQALKPDPD